MKINSNITITGADIGASYTTLTSWDPQPAGAGDGDYYILSGSVYRYHTTYDCLVRPVIYKQTNKYLEAHITGSETSTSNITAAGFTTAAGSVTGDGTWVTIPAGTNYWLKTVSGAPMLAYAGYLKSVTPASSDYAGVGIISLGTTSGHYGFSAHRFDSADSNDDPGYVKYTAGDMNYQTTPSGSTFDLTVSAPPWVELYLPQDAVAEATNGGMCWIGHSMIPVKVSGKLTVAFGAYPRWLIGDGTSPNAAIALKTSWFLRGDS
jgi:hypothetical protein